MKSENPRDEAYPLCAVLAVLGDQHLVAYVRYLDSIGSFSSESHYNGMSSGFSDY